MLRTDLVVLDDDELAIERNLEAGRLRDRLRRAGDGLRQSVPVVVPHDFLDRVRLRLACEVAAFLDECGDQRVVDARIDEQVAVGGAAGAEVGRLRHARVACRDVDVGRFVDHHRGVAGADTVGRPARAVRSAHHRLPAGREREVAVRHQVLRQRDARILDALEQIRGRALASDRLAHHAHHLEGRALRARMRREDHRVQALQRVDAGVRRREFRDSWSGPARRSRRPASRT